MPTFRGHTLQHNAKEYDKHAAQVNSVRDVWKPCKHWAFRPLVSWLTNLDIVDAHLISTKSCAQTSNSIGLHVLCLAQSLAKVTCTSDEQLKW